MVDREKFGERRSCFACGVKFYDMHRSPPMCPKCGTDVSRPPKFHEEPAPLPPADLEEEDEELPEELDEKSIEVDTEEDAGGGEEEADE
jgi:hypothetical protein